MVNCVEAASVTCLSKFVNVLEADTPCFLKSEEERRLDK
jgi:hypothetical protein